MPAQLGVPSQLTTLDPLAVIQSLFDQAGQPSSQNETDWGVAEHFTNLLQDPQTAEKIPVLSPETIDNIPDKALCRFQGMVQDMMDPEYFVGAWKQEDGSWRTNKFQDSTAPQHNSENVIWERTPLYFTAVPGLSTWAKLDAGYQPSAWKSANMPSVPSTKRDREDGLDHEMLDAESSEAPASKTARPDSQSDPVNPEPSQNPSHTSFQPGDCIVYSYEKEGKLKLNDAVEVLGVMSKAPDVASLQMNSQAHTEDDFMDDAMAARPLPSQVPRIHALVIRKFSDSVSLPTILYKTSLELQVQVKELRVAVMGFLTKLFGGDTLVAEYFLLQLLCRTYNRTEDAALGILNLGVSNISNAYDDKLEGEKNDSLARVLKAASTLLPACVGLPISIDKLNKESWKPVRDVRTNCMSRSKLQLPENTLLVLDETHLEAGQLNASGIRNLQTLQNLIETKKVDYDFNFYSLPIPTDVPVLILSQGRSLLHAALSLTIPLQMTTSPATFEEIQTFEESSEVASIRAYLALVRQMEFQIEPPMTSFLEQELVKARKQDNSMDATTMSIWLLVARLMALSYGEDKLTETSWAEMKKLDHRRQQRSRSYK